MDLASFSISKRWTSALLLPAAIVALAPMLKAQSDETDTYMGENPDRYASVRVLDGEATIRKGDAEEALSRGVPIAEGDVVESHGRGVLQLADGSRLAFGSDTRFEVASLFTDKDQERQVLLRLDYGRLRVAMGRESEAQIRIDMPSGSVLLSDGSSASIEMERDRTARVKVLSGRMVFQNERDKASLLAGERLTVYSDQDRLDRIQNFNTYGGDSFDSWCDRNLEVRRGPSWERVPPEIRYYADDLDDNGEWVYVDEYRTWCWRPMRVSAEWRPYWQGRWGAYPGGMTWISDEPWGYVTYHHGRWGWGAGLGWYWIPGAYYAPAWVAWHTTDVYFGWAPMGYYNRPATWGHGGWEGGTCWNVIEINFIHDDHIHRHIHDDPRIIRRFNPEHEYPEGNNGPNGHRPLSPPWRQGPLVVNQKEFRNPDQFHRVLQDPDTLRNRFHAYEQQTGRTIYHRPPSDARTPPFATPPPPGTVGFEDRRHLHPPTEHPIWRHAPPSDGPQPITRTQIGSPPPIADPRFPRKFPREQPIHPRGTGNPGAVPPPPPPPPISQPPKGHPGRTVPPEQPIQPHGTKIPVPTPPPLAKPPSGHPGGTTPRDAPPPNKEQTPEGTQPPPPWLKKKRPLTIP